MPLSNRSIDRDNAWRIDPNPTSNMIRLIMDEAFDGNATLRSITGKILDRYDFTGETEKTLNLDHLPSGIYLIEIKNEVGQASMKRFVKQ